MFGELEKYVIILVWSVVCEKRFEGIDIVFIFY